MPSTRITCVLSLGLLLAACGGGPVEYAECDASAVYGQVSICLPELDGYMQAYDVPAVQERADDAEPDFNEVLGFYLSDAQYLQADSAADLEIDDYVKVYATRDLADQAIDLADLDFVYEGILEVYGGGSREEVQAMIDETGVDVRRLGEPQLLEEYRLTNDSFTLVLAVRFEQPDGSYQDVLQTLSGVLVRGHYVKFGLYRAVDGEADIAALKATNDEVLRAFLAANA